MSGFKSLLTAYLAAHPDFLPPADAGEEVAFVTALSGRYRCVTGVRTSLLPLIVKIYWVGFGSSRLGETAQSIYCNNLINPYLLSVHYLQVKHRGCT